MERLNSSYLAHPLQVAVNARWAEQAFLLIGLAAIDLLMVLLGFLLAYTIRFNLEFSWFYQHAVSPIDFYQTFVFFMTPIWLLMFWVFGLYDFRNIFSGWREYVSVFNACTLGVMVIIVATFFFPDLIIARAWLILAWLLVTLNVGTGRFATRRVVQHLRHRGHLQTMVIIVGANEEGQAIARQLQSNPNAGVWVAGFVDDNFEMGYELLPNTPVLGSTDSLSTLVSYIGIHEIIVASTALPREKLLGFFQTFGTANDVNIRMSSGLYELMTTGVEVQEIGNIPLMKIKKVRPSGADTILKGLLDTLVSISILFISLPVMVAIGIAVKLDSPGPILHRRRVVGVGGKLFDAFKFRTMYVDADERLAQDPELRREFEENHKLKDDPRVTRIGRILRPLSLDELPQLFNVLLGQMSLVGPRMITAEEQARYGKFQMNLGTVKPGITGLWQVSGRSDLSYDERVMLDMHYIRNYSIWLDLHLLWQTIPAVFNKRGAY